MGLFAIESIDFSNNLYWAFVFAAASFTIQSHLISILPVKKQIPLVVAIGHLSHYPTIAIALVAALQNSHYWWIFGSLVAHHVFEIFSGLDNIFKLFKTPPQLSLLMNSIAIYLLVACCATKETESMPMNF
jgi:hypothetical protein